MVLPYAELTSRLDRTPLHYTSQVNHLFESLMKKFNPDFHFDVTWAARIEPFSKDGARIYDVGPRIELVPPPKLTHPLQRAEYERYLGQQVPVTFMLDVPLQIIAGTDLEAFIADVAFEEPVVLSDFSYRAVGVAYGDFDGKYNGRVYLQIICAVDAPT